MLIPAIAALEHDLKSDLTQSYVYRHNLHAHAQLLRTIPRPFAMAAPTLIVPLFFPTCKHMRICSVPFGHPLIPPSTMAIRGKLGEELEDMRQDRRGKRRGEHRKPRE